MWVKAGSQGISQISVQTNNRPIINLGQESSSFVYAYQDQNWDNFNDPLSGTKGFYGLYGTTDSLSGNLNSIGYIEKDVQCQFNYFEDKMPISQMNWNTPVAIVPQPVLPSEYQDYLATKPTQTGQTGSGDSGSSAPQEGTITPSNNEPDSTTQDTEGGNTTGDTTIEDPKKIIPTHTHDAEAETGLVVVTVLVWLAVAALIGVFIYQFCKEKKSNSAIAYEV